MFSKHLKSKQFGKQSLFYGLITNKLYTKIVLSPNGHICFKCCFVPEKTSLCDIIESLPSRDVKMSLVYIFGDVVTA